MTGVPNLPPDNGVTIPQPGSGVFLVPPAGTGAATGSLDTGTRIGPDPDPDEFTGA